MSDALDTLAAAIVNQQAVLVLGTGVTVAATKGSQLATWAGLLRHGLAHCNTVGAAEPNQCNRYSAELDYPGGMDEYLAAASFIEAKLARPNGRFSAWLEESVGQLVPDDDRLIRALDRLDTPLLTTNYDSLVTAVTGRTPGTWRDASDVGRLLRGNARLVYHLHGVWNRPDTVVLGVRSYAQVAHHRPIQDCLKAVTLTRPLIFIGCGAGLSDPNFGALLEWLRTHHAETSGRHYRLALTSEVADLRNEYKGDPIDVIPYGDAHADLLPFIEQLVARVDATRGTAPRRPGRAEAPRDWHLPPDPLCLGRAAEVAQAVTHLCAPKPRPVPILGGPGIGKTTISLRALHHEDVVARFGSRRAFVRCDGLTDPAALLGRIAEAIRTLPGPDLDARVLADLASAPAAIALDNFETPWEADQENAEVVLARVASIPGLALLVSVRGEERPMNVAWTDPIDVRRLDAPTTRLLFLDKSRQSFGSDSHLEQVLAITDGIPLAIVLLAHRAEGEPDLAHVFRAWQEQRSTLLSRAGDQKPSRLTNLAVSLELSISGSPRMAAEPHAKRLLSVLAHLPAGVAHDDLTSVFPEKPLAGAAVLRKVGLATDEGKRIRLLAPIAEHVRLTHPAQPDDLLHAMGFYADLVAQEGPKVGAEGGAVAVLRLEPELPNCAPAIEEVVKHDTKRAARACMGLAGLCRFTGLGSPAVIEQVAHRARECADHLSEADCIRSLGETALTRSDHDTARARFEEALPLFRRVEDVLGEAHCVRSLGGIALRRSDHDTARARFEEALHLYRRIGDVHGEASCIRSLGQIAIARSDDDTARARFEEALPLFRRVGDVLGEANCIWFLGNIALARSDHDTARARFEEALSLFRRVGDVLGEANCIRSLGEIALARSDFDAACARFEEALPLYRRVGDVLGEANCIVSLGDIALKEEDVDQARSQWTAALALYGSIPESYSIGLAHRRLARISTGPERAAHVKAVFDAWTSLDLPKLVDQLRAEFPDDCPAA